MPPGPRLPRALLAEDGRGDPGQLTSLFRWLSGRGNTQGALRTWVDTVAAGASPAFG